MERKNLSHFIYGIPAIKDFFHHLFAIPLLTVTITVLNSST